MSQMSQHFRSNQDQSLGKQKSTRNHLASLSITQRPKTSLGTRKWQCGNVTMSACLLLRIGVGQIRIFSHRQFQMATVPQQGFSKAWRRRTEMPQDKECKRCKQCVRTSLFIELYYVILKIRMTLFPCFHLVSNLLYSTTAHENLGRF